MRLLLLIILVSVLVSAAIYPRVMRIDVARWHVDPLGAPDPASSGVRYLPGSDTPVELYDHAPAALLSAFDAAVMDTPRTRRLAGSVSAGRISYVYKSPAFGFQDITTVEAIQVGEKWTLAIVARSALGPWGDDWDSNAARVATWLDGMNTRLGT